MIKKNVDILQKSKLSINKLTPFLQLRLNKYLELLQVVELVVAFWFQYSILELLLTSSYKL